MGQPDTTEAPRKQSSSSVACQPTVSGNRTCPSYKHLLTCCLNVRPKAGAPAVSEGYPRPPTHTPAPLKREGEMSNQVLEKLCVNGEHRGHCGNTEEGGVSWPGGIREGSPEEGFTKREAKRYSREKRGLRLPHIFPLVLRLEDFYHRSQVLHRENLINEVSTRYLGNSDVSFRSGMELGNSIEDEWDTDPTLQERPVGKGRQTLERAITLQLENTDS